MIEEETCVAAKVGLGLSGLANTLTLAATDCIAVVTSDPVVGVNTDGKYHPGTNRDCDAVILEAVDTCNAAVGDLSLDG